MKIGHLDNKVPAAPATERRPAATVPQAGAEASATVDLSATAALQSSVNTEATFDAAKVAHVAKAISDGSYKVDADAIADKLIGNAQELLGRGSR